MNHEGHEEYEEKVKIHSVQETMTSNEELCHSDRREESH
jgi:hypothetical protein